MAFFCLLEPALITGKRFSSYRWLLRRSARRQDALQTIICRAEFLGEFGSKLTIARRSEHGCLAVRRHQRVHAMVVCVSPIFFFALKIRDSHKLFVKSLVVSVASRFSVFCIEVNIRARAQAEADNGYQRCVFDNIQHRLPNLQVCRVFADYSARAAFKPASSPTGLNITCVQRTIQVLIKIRLGEKPESNKLS